MRGGLLHLLLTLAAGLGWPGTHRVLELRDPQIRESSGLVASRTPGVLLTVNDSGDTARVFAVGRRGCTVGVMDLTGVTSVDAEDLARGPGDTVLVGDIGEGRGGRTEVAIHRFMEPRLRGADGCPAVAPRVPVAVQTLLLRYPDGPHDAETLLVDPLPGGRIGIVTKAFDGPEALYLVPRDARPGVVATLVRAGTVSVAGVPLWAPTGGAVSPDGRLVAVRGYGEITLWRRPRGASLLSTLRRPPARVIRAPDAGLQGEAVAFSRDGDALLTSSEGRRAPVYRIWLDG